MTDIPQVLKDALYSPQIIGALKAIGDKNKLHLDVVGEIEAFVNLRIMGAIDDADFMKGIRTSVKETKVADTVLTDINTAIFGPLRAKLNASTEAVKITRVEDDMPAAVRAGPAPAARISGTQVKEVRTIDVTMPSKRLLEEPKVPVVVEAEFKATTLSPTSGSGGNVSENVATPVKIQTAVPTAPTPAPPKPREEIPILKQNVAQTTPVPSAKVAPSTRAPELIKTVVQYKDTDPYHEPI
ncbi:MAG: hypothetical protein AAB573_05325 [Patescibacteria group bacterium]